MREYKAVAEIEGEHDVGKVNTYSLNSMKQNRGKDTFESKSGKYVTSKGEEFDGDKQIVEIIPSSFADIDQSGGKE